MPIRSMAMNPNRPGVYMRPDDRQTVRISDLTLETVIILIFGIFMFLFGLLGFVIQTGTLPYNPDGAYGLILVLISLQIITLGKSPFGTYRRSWSLILLGIGIAAIGTIACFIPGLIGDGVRILVGILMTAGGIALILHLIGVRAGTWVCSPGILRHLAVSCGLVYLMEILFGIVSLIPGIRPGSGTAILCTGFGISLFYLAWTLTRITRLYPRKIPGSVPGASGTQESDRFFLFRDATLPTQIAVAILLGVIFILFSLLLVPVGQGIFPFSRDSQFGLLMVIMAFQVLALGKTPLGVYERSLPLMLIGLAVVSLGIYSCIIPGLITGWILIPLGAWSIITGSAGLTRLTLPYLPRTRGHSGKADHTPKKLRVTVALLHLVTIFFGINLVCSGLIPGIAIPVILLFLGILFLLLAHTLLHLPALGKDRINRIS